MSETLNGERDTFAKTWHRSEKAGVSRWPGAESSSGQGARIIGQILPKRFPHPKTLPYRGTGTIFRELRRRLSALCYKMTAGSIIAALGCQMLFYNLTHRVLCYLLCYLQKGHLAVEDPTEPNGVIGLHLLLPRASPLGQPTHPRRQLANIILRVGRLPRQVAVRDIPPLDQVLHDVRVVLSGVHTHTLRHAREVVKQVPPVLRLVLIVVHQMRGHDNLLLHHVGESQHSTLLVTLKELVHNALIRDLVTALISSNGAANLTQSGIPLRYGVSGGVSVGYLGRALLERCVDKPEVRVVLGLRVHPRTNQVLDGHLHRPHINAARQPEILVHEIAVAVLLGGPRARPPGPRGVARARLVAGPVKGIEHVHVGGQSLLRNHVAHQANKMVVRDARTPLLNVLNLVQKVGRLGIREKILWLPALLHGLEQPQQLVLGKVLQGLHHLQALRSQRVGHLIVYLVLAGRGLHSLRRDRQGPTRGGGLARAHRQAPGRGGARDSHRARGGGHA
eukprot:7319880-Pyramimonas_sp.AAC.1